MTACTPAPSQAPKAGSAQAALGALRTADVAAFREALGLNAGHAGFARQLATRLDPETWRIALGVEGREHDLAAVLRCLRSGDDAGLQAAMGYGEQALTADVLEAGRTVYRRRSGLRDYFEKGAAPLGLLPADAHACPPGVLAYQLELWGNLEGRACKARLARNTRGLCTLVATADIAPPATPAGEAERFALPPADGLIDLPLLPAADWRALRLKVVREDGSLSVRHFGHDERGWFVASREDSTRRARLCEARDRRLLDLRAAALRREVDGPGWPKALADLGLKAHELADPAAPADFPGWAAHEAAPQTGFELVPGRDAIAALAPETDGRRRAVTREGALVWLE
ncbi:MAG: hypothetical protein IT463_12765 [Planctomycetes bacterium]|nr:hypothetical protein [Planctomycetota bacterium]